MAKRTWILLDVGDDQYTDEIRLTSADADGVPEGIGIVKRRLRGKSRDLDVSETVVRKTRFEDLKAFTTEGESVFLARTEGTAVGGHTQVVPVERAVRPDYLTVPEPHSGTRRTAHFQPDPADHHRRYHGPDPDGERHHRQ